MYGRSPEHYYRPVYHLFRFAIRIVTNFLNGPIPASFCLFSSFPHHTIQYIYESVDDMLGTQTRGDRMEGTDESTSHFLIYDTNMQHFKCNVLIICGT